MITREDAVILGRRSYDEWPQGSDLEPFTSFLNAVSKLVVTSAGGAQVARARHPARSRGATSRLTELLG